MHKELQYYLQQNFHLPGTVNEMQDAENYLSEKMNELIKNDFNHLVQILYRLDVSEAKLKQVLRNNPNEDAGKIISSLIIERQLQKIQSRRQSIQQDDSFSEEEKW